MQHEQAAKCKELPAVLQFLKVKGKGPV